MSDNRPTRPEPEAPWTTEDEERLRASLAVLRRDVDTNPLPDPRFVRARGAQRRRRAALAWTAGVAAVTIALAGVGLSAVTQNRAADPTVPATSTTLPTTPAPTTPAPSGTTDATTAPTTPSPTSDIPATPCGSTGIEVNVDGVPEPAAATAEHIADLVTRCDVEGLVALVTKDKTELSFGALSAEQALDPSANQGRYEAIRAIFAMPPEHDAEFGLTKWPAEPKTRSDWDAFVTTGLLTERDMAQMRDMGSGYIGWRVVINDSGRLTAWIAGD